MGAGQSLGWTTEASSLSGDGTKVVLSDAIEGLSPDRFLEAFRQFALTREPIQYEKAYRASEMPDGSILAVASYDAAHLLGPGRLLDTYTVLHYRLDKDEVVSESHAYDETLSERTKQTTSVTKVYRDPFRIEFHMLQHPVRASGPLLMGGLNAILQDMGSAARANFDVDSPGGGGLKSVVSDPIEDCAVTAETYVEWAKQQSLTKAGGTLQPDGSVTAELSSWFMGTSYRRHVFDAANGEVLTTEFGLDPTLSQVESIVHCKVHARPFRLEMWADLSERVRANDQAKKMIEALVTPVLTKLAEEG